MAALNKLYNHKAVSLARGKRALWAAEQRAIARALLQGW